MEPFRWGSPLGIAVALFLVWGAIYVIIGVLTPVFLNRGAVSPPILLFSARTDTVLFGVTPDELWRTNRPLVTLRTITVQMFAGMLLTTGVLVLAVAWYGLRSGAHIRQERRWDWETSRRSCGCPRGCSFPQ